MASHENLFSFQIYCYGNENAVHLHNFFIVISQPKHMLMAIGLDKQIFMSLKLLICSYPSVSTYVLDTQKNRLIHTGLFDKTQHIIILDVK